MQAIGRQPQCAADGFPVPFERHSPEQITLYRLVHLHAETKAIAGADLRKFVNDEFEPFLECGILTHTFANRSLRAQLTSTRLLRSCSDGPKKPSARVSR